MSALSGAANHEYASTPSLLTQQPHQPCMRLGQASDPTVALEQHPLNSFSRFGALGSCCVSITMSGQPSTSGAQAAANEPPLSALSTSTLGSAPKRVRHREEQIESAYELQRNAAMKGALLYTALGASTCFMAHHLFPGFRRQTLALKGVPHVGRHHLWLCRRRGYGAAQPRIAAAQRGEHGAQPCAGRAWKEGHRGERKGDRKVEGRVHSA
ncbi:hypothetical protein L1887_51486 [Cichorium endivia]|nr:hypothetical protein L1887_51486 [Cichorium endivia]